MRAWNQRFSLRLFSTLFGYPNSDAREAFRKYPYGWLWILIPIAGVAFFYGLVWQEDLNRRSREIRERISRLEERRSVLKKVVDPPKAQE